MTEEVDRPYAGQEAEINDKLLLDLAWERQQKKTFTAWCNSHVRKVGIQIKELYEDLRDGITLLKLLEIIAGEKITPAEKRGRMRVHKIANVGKALAFISSKGVKLAGIGAEEIVDGNSKMTLGMIWTIILRFAIQDISVEELSAKEGLLLWCQRKTAPYKNVNVQNFHMSFKDGLAFCALIHRHRPELIDYDSLKKGDDLYNLNYAFEVAEKHLDIPKMLDAEDIHSTPKPDERAIMTYVSSYYHAFSSSAQAAQAAKRIGKVLNVNQENEKMMEEYETMASNLLEWIQRTMPWLQDRMPENTLQATQERLEEFRQYGTTTKPPKTDEKAKLETHFHTLQTKLRLSSRPAYVPSEGKLVSDINSAWRSLEEAEKAKEEYLRAELRRLQRLELLASKFDSKATKVESWAVGKDDTLMQTDDIEGSNLAEIMALQKIHETFCSDVDAENNRIGQLEAIARELTDYQYYNADAVNARIQLIKATMANMSELAAVRTQRIQEAIEKQQQLDELRLNFAKKGAAFNNWMDNTMDDLQDAFVCSSTEEVEQLQNELEEFKAGPLQEANENYDELNGFVTRMAELGSTDNPYTTLTPTSVYDKWCKVLDTVPERENILLTEMEKQQTNEQLRLAFAEKANALSEYIEQRGTQLAEQSMQGHGTMEDQLQALVTFESDTLTHQPEIESAEEIHRQTQAALIFDNKHATVTMEGLRANWTGLLLAIQRAKNETENQILIRDSKGLTEEQIKEYRQSFDHFDRDSSGMLDKNEYRACLLSLGYKLGSDPTNDPEFERLWAEIDPNETGHVSFEAFLDFMATRMVDQDTADQVLESFKVLAGDKPYITADELRRELPPEQAEYCIARMAPYGGEGAPEGALDYMSFSSALYGQSEL